ncbi:hypothetical protein D3C71_1881170 [compost metagenome]
MRKLRQITDSAGILQLASILKTRCQCHEVDRLTILTQLHHRFVDQLMRLVVEIFGSYPLHCGNERLGLEQYRSEHRLFRLQILRGNPVVKQISAHPFTPPSLGP